MVENARCTKYPTRSTERRESVVAFGQELGLVRIQHRRKDTQRVRFLRWSNGLTDRMGGVEDREGW